MLTRPLLRLFGHPSIDVGGSMQPLECRQGVRSLLALLAVHHAQPVAEERVVVGDEDA